MVGRCGDFVRSQWERVEKAMDHLHSTIRNDYGFIENYNVGQGWVESLVLLPVAMWKSNLAGCWAEALRQMAYRPKYWVMRKKPNHTIQNSKTSWII